MVGWVQHDSESQSKIAVAGGNSKAQMVSKTYDSGLSRAIGRLMYGDC